MLRLRYLLNFAVFIAGLAVVAWIARGYAGSNALALAVTLLIGLCYAAGALELRRHHQATASLAGAVQALDTPPASLDGWLATLPPGLRHAVRLRVEGERTALPGPMLSPYLTGLLVLLGMLGTFLGMVATLRGTGLALENAADLQAIRASLAAPVKGLGFAFGTSVAGVAASAALGMLTALYRRERARAVQGLDAAIAGTLHAHTPAYQRQQNLQLLQRQADAMPALTERLQGLMTAIEQQSQALGAQLAAGQQAFHEKTEAAYAALAASVARSLQDSVAASAGTAAAAIQPAVESTLQGLARDTAALRDALAQTAREQLEAMNARAAQQLEAVNAHAAQQLETVNTHAARQLEAMSAHASQQLEAVSQGARQQAETLEQAVTRQLADLARETGAALDRCAQNVEQRSATLLEQLSSRLETSAKDMAATWQRAVAQQEQAGRQLAADTQATLQTVTQQLANLTQETGATLTHCTQAVEQCSATLLEQLSTRLETAAGDMAAVWQQAAAQQEQAGRQLAADTQAALQAAAQRFEQQSAALLQTVQQAHADITAELRGKLSDSLARDNAALQERGQLLGTLSTLLDAVNHAATEQRAAVDALVSAAGGLLEQAQARFGEQVQAEAARLTDTASHVERSADDIARLSAVLQEAVQGHGEANARMAAQLQAIETALEKTMARGDEQLAYYVAQAREVVDLTLLSQKQILENLQQLAATKAGGEAA